MAQDRNFQIRKISWFEIGLEINKYKEYWINSVPSGKDQTFYGPYRLVDPVRRIMENKKGNKFMHYAEDFYIILDKEV
jgi:hypothetical protein